MAFNRPSVTVLLATTFLTAWSVIPQAAAQESEQQATTFGLQINGQSVITRGNAILDLDVMNRDGQHLGNLADFIINLTEGELLYALLGTERPDDEAEAEAEADLNDNENGQPDEETTDSNGQSLYPIPFEALELAMRSDFEPDEGAESDGNGESADSGPTESPLLDLTAEEVTGLTVYSADDEEVSSVREVVHDASADDIRLILGVGGFLGIGEQSVGIPVQRFTFHEEAQSLQLEMTREQIRDLPSYEYPDEAVLDPETRLGEVIGHESADSEADAGNAESSEDNGNGEEPQDAQNDAANGEAGDDQQSAGGEARLQDMVLILDISPEDLESAPSFQEGQFPNVQDERWHAAVVGFYRELLGAEALGVDDATDNGAGTEPSQTPEETDAD